MAYNNTMAYIHSYNANGECALELEGRELKLCMHKEFLPKAVYERAWGMFGCATWRSAGRMSHKPSTYSTTHL
jgi:hypothetical protein